MTFRVSLVSPNALAFEGMAIQVDLPGAEGDLGVLAGHAPIVTLLRPGIVTVLTNGAKQSFVVLGGVAEFSQSGLNVLADSVSSVEDFDLDRLKFQIEEKEANLSALNVGRDLDQEIELLDHYKRLHQYLTVKTAL